MDTQIIGGGGVVYLFFALLQDFHFGKNCPNMVLCPDLGQNGALTPVGQK
jgi:hypothetical protein